MGRTTPTYRQKIKNMKSKWSKFREGLKKEDKKYFDRIFERAQFFADAGSYANHPNSSSTVILSVLVSQEKEIQKLRDKIDES